MHSDSTMSENDIIYMLEATTGCTKCTPGYEAIFEYDADNNETLRKCGTTRDSVEDMGNWSGSVPCST